MRIRNKANVLGLAMAVGVLAAMGCTSKSESAGKAGGTKPASTLAQTDDRIESSFKKTYVYTRYLKNDDVKLKARDGAVVLSGTVAWESHKALAEDTALGLPGVTRVDNRLVTTAEDATATADTWIGRKVNLSLMFHRDVNADRTIVAVKDGVVTLSGESSSLAQKELTGEYARDIEGVTSVQNQMLVVADPVKENRTAGEKMDDASITAQVKTALRTHRSTSSVKTRVETRNGEVTLTGIARNDAEKSLVTKLVGDIQGVTSVDNQMTIEVAMTQ